MCIAATDNGDDEDYDYDDDDVRQEEYKILYENCIVINTKIIYTTVATESFADTFTIAHIMHIVRVSTKWAHVYYQCVVATLTQFAKDTRMPPNAPNETKAIWNKSCYSHNTHFSLWI